MNKEWNEEIDSISSSMDLVNDEINVSDEFDKLSKISKEAYDLIKEGKLDEAKDLFYKILEQESENHYALVGLGDISRKKGEFPEAIDFYKRCLDSYHENKYALIGLADVYREMGNYKESIHLWEHFIVHYGVDITVLTRLADSYRKLGDYENAKKFYKQVFEIDPKNSYALTGIGYLYFETETPKILKGTATITVSKYDEKMDSYPEGWELFSDFIWIGRVSTNWTDEENWGDYEVYPDENSKVTIPVVNTNNYPIIKESEEFEKDIVIDFNYDFNKVIIFKENSAVILPITEW